MSKFRSLPLLPGTLVLLSGCSSIEIFNAKGPVASSQKFLILYSIVLILVICFVVPGMFAVFIYKYSYNKNAEFGEMHHDTIIETVWFVIPTIIVAALAIPTVKTLYDYEKPPKSEKDPMVVYAVGAGCKWFFVYPDEHVKTVNTLTIPKDRPVVFKLQTMDTMTSLWIPQLGGQKCTMTSMAMNWTLEVSQTGTFRGRSSNFNGEGFSRQTFKVNAVSQKDYNKWVEEVKGEKTLDQDTFDKQLLPDTPSKALEFNGTHMAFVDPATDPEYVFCVYKRFDFELKDPDFTNEESIFKDVSDKLLIPAHKAQITSANHKRHGIELIVPGGDEPYNNEFKEDESRDTKEMKEISKDTQDQGDDDHGSRHQ